MPTSITEIVLSLCLLAIAIFLLLLIASIAFQAWWMVPFVPTPMPIVRTMVRLAQLKQADHIIDLGAGDGRILIEAKKYQPQTICTGYEGSYLVWLLGKIRIFLHCKEPINFHCSNFFEADVRSADVIFTYLSMQTMKNLLPKFEAELRAGTRIITHAFRIPNLTPQETAEVPMSFGGTTKVYLYAWKERSANGTSAQ